jgi:MFS family permease
MGVLFSAFFWTYSTFQIAAGWLVDRYPVKWVFAGGFLIWSLSTAATGAVNSLGSLIAARLALGAGESVAYPAISKILVRAFPESTRGVANALVDAGAKLGPGLSTLAGGFAVAAFGWRGLFFAAGLGSLLWLIPWLAMPSIEPNEEDATPRRSSPGWRDLLSRRAVWGTSLGMFALGYTQYFLLTWLPSYLVQERGLTMSSMAVLGSLPFLGMAAASLVAGWCADRSIKAGRDVSTVRKGYAISGLILCGLVILPAPAVANANFSIGLITGACVCLGGFTANVWAITQTLAGPMAAGRWTGLQNCIGNLGGVLAPLVTAWIVSITGSFLFAFWAATAALLLGAGAYFALVGRVQPLTWLSAKPPVSATA